MKNNILVTGGSGNLGSAIVKSGLLKNIFFPTKKKLNIHFKNDLKKFIKNKNINLIIHTAAIARMAECEKSKYQAFKTNTLGTLNIVNCIQELNKKNKLKIKLVYISTDAVYACTTGNYKESDENKILPFNTYGWTKLLAEYAVKKCENYLIIRGRFFNKNKIKFKFSATDIYSSGIEIDSFVKILIKLIKKKTYGIVNVGQKKVSDFKKYLKYINDLKKCKKEFITKNLPYKIGIDSSLNIKKMKILLNRK